MGKGEGRGEGKVRVSLRPTPLPPPPKNPWYEKPRNMEWACGRGGERGLWIGEEIGEGEGIGEKGSG